MVVKLKIKTTRVVYYSKLHLSSLLKLRGRDFLVFLKLTVSNFVKHSFNLI